MSSCLRFFVDNTVVSDVHERKILMCFSTGLLMWILPRYGVRKELSGTACG